MEFILYKTLYRVDNWPQVQEELARIGLIFSTPEDLGRRWPDHAMPTQELLRFYRRALDRLVGQDGLTDGNLKQLESFLEPGGIEKVWDGLHKRIQAAIQTEMVLVKPTDPEYKEFLQYFASCCARWNASRSDVQVRLPQIAPESNIFYDIANA